MAEAPRVWALLGRRAGDNRQVLTLAEAAGLPFEAKPLRFNPGRALPTLLRRGSLHTLTLESRALVAPPWPDVVIAAGKRSAPIALWIRMASGGRTRLVHVGRPWAPLSWFDRVVTTAQYGLPARANVIRNTLPLAHAPAEAEAIPPALAALPSPRLVLLAGGSSRPLMLDAAEAR
ncbi:ELM1/GtrOC1 family putative glycosyltransferase, partial [Methylopila musalis]